MLRCECERANAVADAEIAIYQALPVEVDGNP